MYHNIKHGSRNKALLLKKRKQVNNAIHLNRFYIKSQSEPINLIRIRGRLIMPRIARMVIDDETTVYHVMSRTAFDGFPLGDVEP
jgi:hypothetical protein